MAYIMHYGTSEKKKIKAKINAYACTFNAIQSYLLLTVFAGTSPNITNEFQHFLHNELTI